MSSAVVIRSNNRKYETFDILDDTSECFTSVKLMDTLGNINRSGSIDGVWVYYSKYK